MGRYIRDKVYKEVWELLKIKNEIRDKIPEDILIHIKKLASRSSYELFSDKSEDNIIANISTDAFCLYTSLYMQYVANDEEKEKLKKVLIENEINYKRNVNTKNC